MKLVTPSNMTSLECIKVLADGQPLQYWDCDCGCAARMVLVRLEHVLLMTPDVERLDDEPICIIESHEEAVHFAAKLPKAPSLGAMILALWRSREDTVLS